MDTVFNGLPDYSYRDLLRESIAFYYMNPSGSTMAFAQFNDTLVTVKEHPIYEIESLNGKYPTYQYVLYRI